MTELLVKEEISLKLPFPELTDDQFFDLCAAHSDHRIERTAQGKIIIMPGTGFKTGNRNAALTAQLYMWAIADRRGVAADSSTMFRLPNSAMRSPDAAWVDAKQMAGLSEPVKERFLPLSPDFVVELTSPTDRLSEVQQKLQEWIDNGCRLGWILHVAQRCVHIYRPGREVEILQNPTQVQGDGPVTGFTLDLTTIWDPGW